MTDKKNPLFARAAVNRMTLELTGRGFVPVFDGFTPDGDVLHEPLLDQLAREFVRHDYDLKWLIRTIVDSRWFQLAAPSGPQADPAHVAAADKNWNYATVRLLNGDQWHDSVLRASGREAQITALAEQAAMQFEIERNQRLAGAAQGPGEGPHGASSWRRGRAPPRGPAAGSGDGAGARAARRDGRGPQPPGDVVAALSADRPHVTRNPRRGPPELGPTGESLMQMNGHLVRDCLRDTDVPRRHRSTADARRAARRRIHPGSRPAAATEERSRLSDTLSQPSAQRVADLMRAMMQSSEFLTY